MTISLPYYLAERPIPYSAPMVRALLDGRKTQTRRIVDMARVRPSGWASDVVSRVRRQGNAWRFQARWSDAWSYPFRCPYGVPGDRLWVRESVYYSIERATHCYVADGNSIRERVQHLFPKKSRPSLHLLRAASRITLEITGVRVERVEAISDEDAIAEGVCDWRPEEHRRTLSRDEPLRDQVPRIAFLNLFYKTKPSVPRGSNPWVWVIEFRDISDIESPWGTEPANRQRMAWHAGAPHCK